MKHKGLSHYSSEVANNATLGQGGMVVVPTSQEGEYFIAGDHAVSTIGTKNYHPHIKQFCAIKNITASNVGISGTNGGVKLKVEFWSGISGVRVDGSDVMNPIEIHLAGGDILYGCFRSVELEDAGTNGKILLYIG